jgi:GrpB-like predicted nucleotidyltransferase (UPF0157 family)
LFAGFFREAGRGQNVTNASKSERKRAGVGLLPIADIRERLLYCPDQMPLTSVLTPYDDRWPPMYAEAAAWLRPVFGSMLVDLHHVGSTAVLGLPAKPEIDILAVVTDVSGVDSWVTPLAARGFRRGGDLSADHLFFKRDEKDVRTHKLHICIDGHPTAIQMLRFRDHLRRCPADRERYASLKLRLEAENTRGIGEYLEKKAPFIRGILDKIMDA